MNRKSRIATLTGLAIASLVLVAGPASAADYAYSKGRSKAVYDYARVLSVNPVIRYVTVTTPVKECWDDVEYYTRSYPEPGRAGKTLFGAIVGGVIGHQFGSGSGNDAATIAGSLIGAAAASRSHNGPAYRTNEYSRPVRRCNTNYQSQKEERIEGYDVIYTYHGRKYATRTPFDPGKKLKIRVDVRPAA
jgi:uncharacterized protein YcfJ